MYVCHSEGEGARQDLSDFEQGMVVGACAPVCVKNCHGAGFFHAQQFPVCIKNGPTPKGHPVNLTQLWEALESTWASIPVERFQHLVKSMPRHIEVVLMAQNSGG